MWFWFFLVVAVLVAVAVWDFRRKAVKREAASKERLELLLEAKPSAAASVPKSPEPAAQAAADGVPEEPAAIVYAARERLLNQSETLIYLLLKSGMPDHAIFPKVPLAQVVEAPGAGYDREQQLRRLARHHVDFVVCDKAMRVVVAILVQASGPEAAVAQRIKTECLKSSGIRLVTIDPAALPKRAELRTVVFGQAADAGGLGAQRTV